MIEERTVRVDGKAYIVVLSDERETLLAAQAAGRVVVGVEREAGGERTGGLPVPYLVQDPQAADRKYLERVVRRHLGLPWIITETERLVIREFTEEDAAHVLHDPEDGEADRIFYTPHLLREYIRCQYGFYEYGVWALLDRKSGCLIGKAGITAAAELPDRVMRARNGGFVPAGTASDAKKTPVAGMEFRRDDNLRGTVNLELGYHIFTPYRGRGYAAEACRAILKALKEDFDGESVAVFARTAPENIASAHVLSACGFLPVESSGFLPAEGVAGFLPAEGGDGFWPGEGMGFIQAEGGGLLQTKDGGFLPGESYCGRTPDRRTERIFIKIL